MPDINNFVQHIPANDRVTISDMTGRMYQHGLTVKIAVGYREKFEQTYKSVRGFRVMRQDHYLLFSIYQLDLIEEHFINIICDDQTEVVE